MWPFFFFYIRLSEAAFFGICPCGKQREISDGNHVLHVCTSTFNMIFSPSFKNVIKWGEKFDYIPAEKKKP